MRVVFSAVQESVVGNGWSTDFVAPIRAHAIDLDKQAPMRAADYLVPSGRGSLWSLLAPIFAMLVLIVIAYFWFGG